MLSENNFATNERAPQRPVCCRCSEPTVLTGNRSEGVSGAVVRVCGRLKRIMKERNTMIKTDAMFRHSPDMMSVPEAAKELRIGKNRAYELIKEGRLEAIKVGRKLVVPKSALYEFCRDERNYLLVLPNWRK